MKAIFVFGSNLAGRHGAGAARDARLNHGAVYGVGEGRTGDSYAIPTLDSCFNRLQLRRIQSAVDDFITYAESHGALDFYVTRLGCGLAGFKDEEIAPMFRNVPANCMLPVEWRPFIDDERARKLTFHTWEDENAQPR